MSLTQIFSFSHCLLSKAGLLIHLHFQNTNYICLKWGKTTALEFFMGMRLCSLFCCCYGFFTFFFSVNLCESEIMDMVISYVTLTYEVKYLLIKEIFYQNLSWYNGSIYILYRGGPLIHKYSCHLFSLYCL